MLRIADWQGRVMAALAHMGQTLVALTASEVAEVSLGSSGASSTMPQKQNPVGPSALIALNNQFTGLHASLRAAAVYQHQRDGAAWFTEWMVLPQLSLSLASALQHALRLAEGIVPQPLHMRATLDGNLGLIHAEALSFALADILPRPEAQAKTKALCLEARDKQVPLQKLAQADYPSLPDTVFDPVAGMGQAAQEALDFAKRAGTV